jgi:hypothetical protein
MFIVRKPVRRSAPAFVLGSAKLEQGAVVLAGVTDNL